MSATDSVKPAGDQDRDQDHRAHEPSMEEILASIRRIIADDQVPPPKPVAFDEPSPRVAVERPRHLIEPDPTVVAKPDLRGSTENHPVPLRFQAPTKAMPAEPFRPDPPQFEPPQPAPRSEQPKSFPQSEAPVSNFEAAPRASATPMNLGHIAAPQFAMPDTPMLRGVAQQKRGAGEAEAALLRFAPPSETASKPLDVETGRANAIGAAPTREEAAPQMRPNAMPEPASRDTDPDLFSSATDDAVTNAFNVLAASRLVENDDALKDMVRDMIRPLLKNWLDDNLPSMVERLVRHEIERVARGGR